MDPNETLRRLREIVAEVHQAVDSDQEINGGDAVDLLIEAAGLVQALDEWLMKGGFPPSDWYEARKLHVMSTRPVS